MKHGRVDDVMALVLGDRSRLDELYACLFSDDAWTRMRAADAIKQHHRSKSVVRRATKLLEGRTV